MATMQQVRGSASEDQEAAADRQTASLAALAVTLLLVVVGLVLVQQLRAAASFEDCVMSGRSACGQAAPP